MPLLAAVGAVSKVFADRTVAPPSPTTRRRVFTHGRSVSLDAHSLADQGPVVHAAQPSIASTGFHQLQEKSTDGVTVAKAGSSGAPLVTIAFNDPSVEQQKVLSLRADPDAGTAHETLAEARLDSLQDEVEDLGSEVRKHARKGNDEAASRASARKEAAATRAKGVEAALGEVKAWGSHGLVWTAGEGTPGEFLDLLASVISCTEPVPEQAPTGPELSESVVIVDPAPGAAEQQKQPPAVATPTPTPTPPLTPKSDEDFVFVAERASKDESSVDATAAELLEAKRAIRRLSMENERLKEPSADRVAAELAEARKMIRRLSMENEELKRARSVTPHPQSPMSPHTPTQPQYSRSGSQSSAWSDPPSISPEKALELQGENMMLKQKLEKANTEAKRLAGFFAGGKSAPSKQSQAKPRAPPGQAPSREAAPEARAQKTARTPPHNKTANSKTKAKTKSQEAYEERMQMLKQGNHKASPRRSPKKPSTAQLPDDGGDEWFDLGAESRASSHSASRGHADPLISAPLVRVESKYIAPGPPVDGSSSDDWVDATLALEDYEYQSSSKIAGCVAVTTFCVRLSLENVHPPCTTRPSPRPSPARRARARARAASRRRAVPSGCALRRFFLGRCCLFTDRCVARWRARPQKAERRRIPHPAGTPIL